MIKTKTIVAFIILIPLLSLSLHNNSNNLVLFTNAQNYENSWNLKNIEIKGAWEITNGSKDITVAVVDSGIDFSHPELAHAEWINENEIANNSIDDDANGYIDDTHGWDFVSNDNVPGPQTADPIHWHATFIAGLIAALRDGDGIVGVAPNVTIMDVRVLTAGNWQGTTNAGFGDAIKYAVDNGADVINLSLHYYANSSDYYDDILYAIEQNVPVVSITGNSDPPNEGAEIRSFPGGFEEVISVGATNPSKEKTDYSNYGEWTEIVAPVGDSFGPVRLFSTVPYDVYQSYIGWGWGTSFACPQVAGVIALMRTLNHSISVAEIRDILHTTAIDLGDPGKDIYFGYGLLNATAAVLETYYRHVDPSARPPELTNTSFASIGLAFIFLAVLPITLKKIKNKKK
ncbi:MAG: S8 family serine peptidase [Candidatus Heimdallarchaeota archaeon]|nr:S8 family serine peptidase [Candidatus Heimdallarchaeota archaeon]MCK4955836.1 S8 family serine peptidase [Candidatus Heimdallarchaeota archaeon]